MWYFWHPHQKKFILHENHKFRIKRWLLRYGSYCSNQNIHELLIILKYWKDWPSSSLETCIENWSLLNYNHFNRPYRSQIPAHQLILCLARWHSSVIGKWEIVYLPRRTGLWLFWNSCNYVLDTYFAFIHRPGTLCSDSSTSVSLFSAAYSRFYITFIISPRSTFAFCKNL